ncbi:unnamed protein product, partial [Adineta ricciae]
MITIVNSIDSNIVHISDGSILNKLCCEPLLDSCDDEVDVNCNGDS